MPTQEEVARGLTQNGRSKKRKKQGWRGFVDIGLSEADKDKIAEDEWEEAGYEVFIEDIVEDGYKFSVSPDKKHNCIVASITGRVTGSDNDNLTLSARGPDFKGAVRCLCFKHVVLCDSGLWENYAASSKPSAFG